MGMNDILKIILVSLILIILTILITLVGIGKIELTFDVNSVFVIAIPIVVTHIIVNSLTLIWSFIFTLWTSYEKIIGIIATLIWMFELGIGFVVNTTTNLDLLFL